MNDVKFLPKAAAGAAAGAAVARHRPGGRDAEEPEAGPADGVYKPYAMMLVGMLNWTDFWFRPSGPMKAPELCERMTQLFLHGFLDER
jgi:hypothetical protein